MSKKIIISHENLLGATAILGLSYSTSDLFKNLNRFYQLASNQENKSENICTILESVFKIIAIPALIGILILKDNIPLFNYTNTLSIAAIGLVIINFALDEILNKLQIKK